jgi:hypothetical protein
LELVVLSSHFSALNYTFFFEKSFMYR